MANKPTTAQKIKALPWDITGNAFNSIFVELTVFGSLFILFLNQLGIDKSQIGFLLSLFPFTGVLAILIAPYVKSLGYKRTFIIFYFLRKCIIALLLLIPWLVTRSSPSFVLQYIIVVIGLFAVSRALSEIGFYPWNQEYIPHTLRGKLSARSSIAATITGFIAVSFGSFILSQDSSLSTFALLMAMGVIAGFISVYAYSRIPGGEPVPSASRALIRMPNLSLPFSNSAFVKYLIGVSLVILATGPLVSFLPLFFSEIIDLDSAQVIRLQIGTKIGSLIFGFLWGWAADRYGSRPVTISGLLMIVLLPIGLIGLQFLPIYVYPVAFLLSLLQGSAFIGWQLGNARMLFVNIVPAQHKNEYLAIYYAIVGVVGGFSQVLGGMYLNYSPTFHLGNLTFNAYTSLMIISIAALLIAVTTLQKIHEHKSISVREFLSFFLTGNTLQAMDTLIRYTWTEGERETVKLTEKLGSSKSHLTVNELLVALQDPRFNVRYEAIHSIARTAPNIQLIRALGKILADEDPSLSVAAAWALGRLGDFRSIETLKTGLNSTSDSVVIQTIRSLSYLRTPGLEEEIHARLLTEKNHALQIAYCSYLGKLKYQPAAPAIIHTLSQTTHQPWQHELILSLARLLGPSRRALNLFKNLDDPHTYFSISIADLSKKFRNTDHFTPPQSLALIQAADHLSKNHWAKAARAMTPIIHQPTAQSSTTLREVLKFVDQQLTLNPKNPQTWILLICCLPQ